MRLLWAEHAWNDYLHFQDTDPKVARRIIEILEETRRAPSGGMGKPEPLRKNLSGWWSRRVTGDHRFVYRVLDRDDAQILEIAACRHHY